MVNVDVRIYMALDNRLMKNEFTGSKDQMMWEEGEGEAILQTKYFDSTNKKLSNIHRNMTLFNSYSAGTDLIRQNLTSTDVKFWRQQTSDSDA